MWPDWPIFNLPGNKISYKSSSNILVRLFLIIKLKCKIWFGYFWGNIGRNWATYYFIIWSHWLPQAKISLSEKSFPKFRNFVSEKSFSIFDNFFSSKRRRRLKGEVLQPKQFQWDPIPIHCRRWKNERVSLRERERKICVREREKELTIKTESISKSVTMAGIGGSCRCRCRCPSRCCWCSCCCCGWCYWKRIFCVDRIQKYFFEIHPSSYRISTHIFAISHSLTIFLKLTFLLPFLISNLYSHLFIGIGIRKEKERRMKLVKYIFVNFLGVWKKERERDCM